MAFPVPAHLPRKRDNDISTKLLTKISETSSQSLSYETASAWVAELDNAIRETKRKIHDRIQSDLPAFESQLTSAKSVQERLRQLGNNVVELHKSISDSESGMIPQLVMVLSQHATLAQEALDSNTKHSALSHLSSCKQKLDELSSLTTQGKLSEAVAISDAIDDLLAHCPRPLESAQVMHDLKRIARSAKDRALDQLNEAYSRCIVVSAQQIVIRTSVPVRQSDAMISLSSILSSIPPSSAVTHMTALRKDLTTHYIDYLLKQPVFITMDSPSGAVRPSELKLTVFPAPPTMENPASRIDNLAQVLEFLREHLFPHLPQPSSFALSLSKPITTALLNHLLIPSLPSSLDALPSFLRLVQRAVDFEREFTGGLLGDKSPEKGVNAWADAVGAHYERKRRIDLLECARIIITREGNDNDSFRAEVSVAEDAAFSEEKPKEMLSSPIPELIPPVEEDAWGLEDEPTTQEPAGEEDGWSFENDIEPGQDPKQDVKTGSSTAQEGSSTAVEDDPWGWNEDEASPPEEADGSTDSSAWDDPWGDIPSEPKPAAASRQATKLERLSNKGKSLSSTSSSAVQSPLPTAAPPPTPAMPFLSKQSTNIQGAQVNAQRPAEKETYIVSGRVKELIFLVENVLDEATELTKSKLLSSTSHQSPVGSILGQTSSFILDLYRALYPVAFADTFSASARRAMGFSNDCIWLSGEVRRASSLSYLPLSTNEKLIQAEDRLKILGESWYEDTIDNQCLKVNEILDLTEGFRDSADQGRYDECEAAINQVLRDIRQFAREVKPVLTKTKYFGALGLLVDAALSRILKDILALSDIPAVESHKLSDLCHILNALEALFVEDPNYPSFVVAYVPSWLKYSYLSELLEASIADISYLFEEGALIDFEIEELVKLVKALFADTPLRASTINKLMHGHPTRS